MHRIQLISVDLFNALVDLSTDRHTLWHTFLGETATPARVEQGWTLSTDRLFTTNEASPQQAAGYQEENLLMMRNHGFSNSSL